MAYLGENIPKLGFGLMRLPMLGEEVDLEQTKKMVDLFMEAGFRYFDTAYGYIGGKSEQAVKTALVDRYPRESFYLATKLPAWAGIKTAEEARAMLDTSLERTGAGYFDFYLLHNLGNDRTEIFERFGLWDFLKQKKAEGVLKHIGFSFHDKADVLDKILTDHPEAEFVQLQFNYFDYLSEDVQSRACWEVARKHGKSVIIMEPVKGGTLATLPPDAEAIFREADPDASVPSWAIRFAASHEGLVTVLSGMSNIAQMEDNLATMKHFVPLSDAEKETVKRVTECLKRKPRIPCTGCSYCTKGCPAHINIPGFFQAKNFLNTFENLEAAKGQYHWHASRGGVPADCLECGQCESVCPQHISVIEELKKVREALA